VTDIEPNLTAGAPTPATPVAEPAAEVVSTAPAPGLHRGTGRRKTSVARVRLVPGDGKILINQRPFDNYFPDIREQQAVLAPLELTGVRKQWDVLVNVRGGGLTGQSGAVKLGLSRALIRAYTQHEAALRDAGYLTRDAREVERKKYGHRKARRRFQFSKR
jgi:small subunit ribosomal protein S9